MDALLQITNVNKSFKLPKGDLKVLEDINLTVQPGEFVCLVGPSGCGKSTLLRIIAGLIKAESGQVHTAANTSLAFVFQNFGLFPWLNVEQNIGFGLKMKGVSDQAIKTEVASRIKQMGLENFEDKHPRELSGGMKQRVGIARALAMNPSILLLDEPFSALDTFTAETLRKDLLDVWHKNQLTIIMVSHLIEEAVELSDRVIVMSPGPGRIKHEAPIKLHRPRNKRSAEFFDDVDQLSALIQH